MQQCTRVGKGIILRKGANKNFSKSSVCNVSEKGNKGEMVEEYLCIARPSRVRTLHTLKIRHKPHPVPVKLALAGCENKPVC